MPALRSFLVHACRAPPLWGWPWAPMHLLLACLASSVPGVWAVKGAIFRLCYPQNYLVSVLPWCLILFCWKMSVCLSTLRGNGDEGNPCPGGGGHKSRFREPPLITPPRGLWAVHCRRHWPGGPHRKFRHLPARGAAGWRVAGVPDWRPYLFSRSPGSRAWPGGDLCNSFLSLRIQTWPWGTEALLSYDPWMKQELVVHSAPTSPGAPSLAGGNPVCSCCFWKPVMRP